MMDTRHYLRVIKLEFMPFDTSDIKMVDSGIGLKPSITTPQIVKDMLSHTHQKSQNKF